MDSEDEANYFLTSLVKDYNGYYDSKHFINLAASTNLTGSKTEWFWDNNGQKVNFQNFPLEWAENQPTGGEVEKCLALDRFYQMHDIDCKEMNGAFCQRIKAVD